MIYLFMAVIVILVGVVVVIDVVLGAVVALPIIGNILETAFSACLTYFIIFALFFGYLIWILVAG